MYYNININQEQDLIIIQIGGDSIEFTLKEVGVFDLYVNHYTLAGDRMNFIYISMMLIINM